MGSRLGRCNADFRGGVVGGDEDPVQSAPLQPRRRAGVGDPDQEKHPPQPGEGGLPLRTDPGERRGLPVQSFGWDRGNRAGPKAGAPALRGGPWRVPPVGDSHGHQLLEPLSQRIRLLRPSRAGPEVPVDVERHPGRHGEPRFRSGGGGSIRDQPDRVRDPVPGASSLLRGGRRYLPSRRRGSGR